MNSNLLKIWKWIRHNPFFAVALVLLSLFLFWLLGCESTAPSPVDPTRDVTRPQLQIEIDSFISRVQIATEQLDKQDKLKQLFAEGAAQLLQGGTVNYFSVLLSALSIVGIGAACDNKRKDGVILDRKKEIKQLKSYANTQTHVD